MQSGQPDLSPWQDDRAANPGNNFWALEGQECDRSSQHRFTKGKLCLTNSLNFCD